MRGQPSTLGNARQRCKPLTLPSPALSGSALFTDLKFQPYAHAEFVVGMIAVSQQAFITDKRLQAIRKHGHQAHKHTAVIAIRSVVVVIKGISRVRIVTHEGKTNVALVIFDIHARNRGTAVALKRRNPNL